MRNSHIDPKVTVLRQLPAFADSDGRELARFARALDQVEMSAGSTLSVEGRAAGEVFVVVDGHAEASRDGVVLWEVGPGDLVGDLDLLGPLPVAVTVVARTPMQLLAIAPQARWTLFGLPSVARWAFTQLGRRTRGIICAPTGWDTVAVAATDAPAPVLAHAAA